MYIDLVALFIVLLFSTPCAVEFSVCGVVFGWACPISKSVVRIVNAAFFALMNSSPNSASAADDITALITCEMFNTAPILRGMSLLLSMKKFPPALLIALNSERYDVLLCIARIVSDAQNVSTASSWVQHNPEIVCIVSFLPQLGLIVRMQGH